VARPPFNAAWTAAQEVFDPAGSTAKVAKVIGGTVAKNITMPGGWKNTCAVRMSFILNRSGMSVPYVAGKTVSGADKRWYFYRVKDVIDFLTQHWGKPDLMIAFPPVGGGQLAGKKGVVLFEISGWTDAAGHATLWNGNLCYDHCYFNEPGATYRTNRANFWALQ
jgi:hypothetical protein